MRRHLHVLAVATVLCVAPAVSAQEAAPSGAPPARVGFQMALRTGYSLPMGQERDAPNADMSNFFAGQVPIFVELGGKPIPNVFVGGYLGLGFGGTAGQIRGLCDQANMTCSVLSVHIGAEFQYHVLPKGEINPWFGYGIGYESTGILMAQGGQSGTVSVTGLEFARFMGGVDFRVSQVFGLGPVVDLSLGNYSRVRSDIPGEPVVDQDLEPQAMHQWLTLGARGVFFP
jgi:hypothetical protein